MGKAWPFKPTYAIAFATVGAGDGSIFNSIHNRKPIKAKPAPTNSGDVKPKPAAMGNPPKNAPRALPIFAVACKEALANISAFGALLIISICMGAITAKATAPVINVRITESHMNLEKRAMASSMMIMLSNNIEVVLSGENRSANRPPIKFPTAIPKPATIMINMRLFAGTPDTSVMSGAI